eukprot:scaffold90_cov163-Ochromonas_danica.AAC.19
MMPGQEGVVQPKSRCSCDRKNQFDGVEDQSHCPAKAKTGRIKNTRSKIDFVIAAQDSLFLSISEAPSDYDLYRACNLAML